MDNVVGLLGWAECKESIDIPEEGLPVVYLMYEMPSIESMQGMPTGAPVLEKNVYVRVGTATRNVDIVGEGRVLITMNVDRALPNKHQLVFNQDGTPSHFLANP